MTMRNNLFTKEDVINILLDWSSPRVRREVVSTDMSLKDQAKRFIDRYIVDLRHGPDLYSHLTMRELSLVGMFATKLAIEQGLTSNVDEAEIGIRVRDRGVGSDILASWIEFKVGNREFAFWRRTMDLYEVHDGAVGDEPIHIND